MAVNTRNLSRREFISGTVIGGVALAGVTRPVRAATVGKKITLRFSHS
jgi:hypothetical protein